MATSPSAVASPQPPFQDWPPANVVDPAGFIWWVRPAAFITQLRVGNPTLEHCKIMTRSLDDLAAKHADEVEAAGGVAVLHDWRRVETYEPDLRSFFFERMRQPRPYHMRAVHVAVSAGTLVRLAVHTVNMISSRALGVEVRLIYDPADSLQRLGVRPTGSP